MCPCIVQVFQRQGMTYVHKCTSTDTRLHAHLHSSWHTIQCTSTHTTLRATLIQSPHKQKIYRDCPASECDLYVMENWWNNFRESHGTLYTVHHKYSQRVQDLLEPSALKFMIVYDTYLVGPCACGCTHVCMREREIHGVGVSVSVGLSLPRCIRLSSTSSCMFA